MCIIIVKKAGVQLPDNDILKTCWDNNPDGAGYMILDNKQVSIKKGFMKYNHFKASIDTIKNSKDIPMILHFRITTHGGTSKANTHPFPLTSNEKLLKIRRVNTDIGIAHNGMIDITNEKGLSDTMQFIKDELSLFNVIKPSWYKDIKSLEYIQNRIGSKLAIMDKEGYIATVGEFYEEEGILYSNYSYASYNNYYNYANWDYGYTYQNVVLSSDENDIVEELENLELLGYEIDALLWEMDMKDLKDILKKQDARDILLDKIYKA